MHCLFSAVDILVKQLVDEVFDALLGLGDVRQRVDALVPQTRAPLNWATCLPPLYAMTVGTLVICQS
jgi:hypothetical protein